MKNIIAVFLMMLLAVPAVPAQDMLDGQPESISGSRKAVRTSTDVVLGVMPAATLGIALFKRDWKGIAIGAAECAGTLAVTYGLKYAVKKRRPDGSDNHSFPSAHTSMAFVAASLVMRRYGWKFGVPAYVLAGYVAWGRTYARKHDFWDVAAGAALGTAVGLIATTPFAREHDLKVAPAVERDPVGNGFVSFGIGGSMTF